MAVWLGIHTLIPFARLALHVSCFLLKLVFLTSVKWKLLERVQTENTFVKGYLMDHRDFRMATGEHERKGSQGECSKLEANLVSC
jgi:hypothetical protein